VRLQKPEKEGQLGKSPDDIKNNKTDNK